ncbi:kelch-like protein 20 [Anopheles maculipalpis]|uniref:kelch-like protein 20 n=1 Tax=Anopheles maculipalpis TaxID=1496333 RepID=UPI002158F8A3|nr:kelch-like protein 20 [Anopheles maculipalpis]
MAEKNDDARSGGSVASTCSALQYDENDSLSARNAMMVNNKWLSDITFIVGPEKQRIYAHKLRLVTASQYFHLLFFGSFVEARLDEIEMEKEDPEIFLTILRLIYGAQVDIDVANIREIYDRIQMYLLPQSCFKPLIDCLLNLVSKDTAMQILGENDFYQFKMVDEMCLRYIQNNPLYYFKSVDFTVLSKEGMLKIVGLQRINCTNDQLRDAVQKWQLANPEADSGQLMSVMDGTLRTYMCDKMFLLGCVATEGSSTETQDGRFELEIHGKPVTFYGIGVYLPPFLGSVSLNLKTFCNGTYKELCQISLTRKRKRMEVVDLVFEPLELEEEKTYQFILTRSLGGYIFQTDYFPFINEPFRLAVNRDRNLPPAFSHVLFKYTDEEQ